MNIQELMQQFVNLDLDRLSPAQEQTLRGEGLPKDYVDFLRDVGWGNLEELQLYDGPVAFDEIHAGRSRTDVVLVGDDFQGYCVGFDRANGDRMVEFDTRGVEQPDGWPDFTSFVKSRLIGSA